jgi:hypothetical protein
MQMREMPAGQWVAFGGYDRLHNCSKPPSAVSPQLVKRSTEASAHSTPTAEATTVPVQNTSAEAAPGPQAASSRRITSVAAICLMLLTGLLFWVGSRSCTSGTSPPHTIAIDRPSSPSSTVKREAHNKPVVNRPVLNRQLSSACKDGNVETMKNLLAQGATANAIDGDGFPVIYIAAYHGDGEMVRLLLEAGANVNAVTRERNTALVAASGRGHVQVVRMLLSRGARVNMSNVRGVTPRDLAARYGHSDVVAILTSNYAR